MIIYIYILPLINKNGFSNEQYHDSYFFLFTIIRQQYFIIEASIW